MAAETGKSPVDVPALWSLCVQSMQSPGDAVAYQRLLQECRAAGRYMLRRTQQGSPMATRMVYRPYQGSGVIAVAQTMSQFLTRGRRMEAVSSRLRVQLARRLKLAVLYDDSSSMTARWRNQNFPYNPVTEETAPQTGAKVGALSLFEALGPDADLLLAVFGSEVTGPLLRRAEIYRELLRRNGSGGSRLDLALDAVLRHPWHSAGGVRLLVVLTDGVPETGRQIPREDIEVQRRTLALLQRLMADGTQVVWVPILTDERLARFVVGEFDAASFSERVARMGVEVAPVKRVEELLESLFGGVSRLLRRWEETEGQRAVGLAP